MADIRTAADYEAEFVKASLSALVELLTILRRYAKALVLVGGWAPYLLLQRHRRKGNGFQHVGSIDIDLAVDPRIIDEPAYATIADLIERRGYLPRKGRTGEPIPFSFEKRFQVRQEWVKIQVDFLTGFDAQRARHRHKDVQPDLKARMARGCEVVFDHNFSHPVRAMLPGDGEIEVEVKVADIVGILTTKGICLGERYKEKDAYDIYSVVGNYEEGPASAAEAVKPFLRKPLVGEAVGNIRKAFASPRANGPSWVATFLGASSESRRERLQQEAFLFVDEFLKPVQG